MGKFPKHYDPKLHRKLNELVDLVETDLRFVQPMLRDLVVFGKKKFDGREPSCRTCTRPGCCYQMVCITVYDAMPIARRLRMEGKATDEYIAQLRQRGEENESVGRVAWFNGAHPCVFLKNNRCTIYEQRPMPCRSYLTWSPSDNCQPEAPEGADTVGLVENADMAKTILRQQLQFQWLLGITGFVLCAGSLPRIVAIVLEAMRINTEAGFIEHIKNQPYPRLDKMAEWMDGKNPFAEQRRRQERLASGAVEPLPGLGADP